MSRDIHAGTTIDMYGRFPIMYMADASMCLEGLNEACAYTDPWVQ